MANTTNLDLVPLDGSDKLKNFPTGYNANLDKIDAFAKKIRTYSLANGASVTVDMSKAGFIFIQAFDGAIAYVKSSGTVVTLAGSIQDITFSGSGSNFVITNGVGWGISVHVLTP